MIRLLSHRELTRLGIDPELSHPDSPAMGDAWTLDERREMFASVFASKEIYLTAWQAYSTLAQEVGHDFMNRAMEIKEIDAHCGWSAGVRFLHDLQELCVESNIAISSPAWMDVARAFLEWQREKKASSQ